MRVLITSPRAPVGVDLARRFAARGDAVYTAESLRFSAGAFSRASRDLRVPRPRDSALKYVLRLQEIVEQHEIDWLIPTSEEIFFIAAHRDRLSCDVLVDDLEVLNRIHNKAQFSLIGSNEFGTVPESHELTSSQQMSEFLNAVSEFVFKPSYSRFAAETLISPTVTQLNSIDVSPSKRWLAQRRIFGTEYSTYGIAREGVLQAHACYRSAFRAGKGSGIYFLPQNIPAIENYVRQFVADQRFTGQIGFDCLIDENDRLWVIEANPRATSGVHLFGEDQPLIECLVGNTTSLLIASVARPPMIGFAMPIWGLADAIKHGTVGQIVPAWFRGRDVLWRWSDPLPTLMLPLTLGELLWISFRDSITLQQAATFDIEWNGETL